MNCRFCNTELNHVFLDLYNSPPSNSFLTLSQLDEPEVYYPLKVYTCHQCFLVQIQEYKKSDDIFDSEYVYFSSYSSTWLKHAERYTEDMIARFHLDGQSNVFEIASNDGYLLQYFAAKQIPVLGIEPTSNTAAVAISKGIETIVEFFGVPLATRLAAEGRTADLIAGNNVLAHVPDINDFVGGLKLVLKPAGVVTMEFPHLLQLVANNQFDTVYHEHFSYLSLHSVKQVFSKAGLEVFDVEELPTHGGSLRIYAKHPGDQTREVTDQVHKITSKEISAGMTAIGYYNSFQEKAEEVKYALLSFLVAQRKTGKTVAAYGAAAKGNTLLNFCGIKEDLISFVVDANPSKQGKLLPGSHIPVVSEDRLREVKPAFVIIFPWNLKEEIKNQLSYIRDWGGQFIIPIPTFEID